LAGRLTRRPKVGGLSRLRTFALAVSTSVYAIITIATSEET
jgi:hypothetical protein